VEYEGECRLCIRTRYAAMDDKAGAWFGELGARTLVRRGFKL